MNERLEDAKKKLRSACVDFLRAEMETIGNAKIASMLFVETLSEVIDSFTEEDFT